MTGVHDLALFVAAGLLLNVTPGPDMAYIAARGAAGGFRAGVAATLGITAGCVAHTFAAAAGLSVLLATSAAARWLTGAVGALFVLLAARLATLERS
jgi:threonine/homoserine/homoserine lactone efflux protein